MRRAFQNNNLNPTLKKKTKVLKKMFLKKGKFNRTPKKIKTQI
jgi:hypothetical protein